MTSKERSHRRKKRDNQVLLKTSRNYAGYFKEKHYYTYGRMCNHSKGGLCFEYDRALQPGVNISLKILDTSIGNQNTPIPSDHKSHQAQVKWCRQIKDTPLYDIGVEYSDDIPERS